MKSKKWSIWLLILSLLTLILFGAVTAIIDPFFHYHKPLFFLQYPLPRDNQRYLNDGIIKHFDYDAIITGTSMTENFKASECSTLFQVNAVKVPFAGGSLAEISDNLCRGLAANQNIRLIIAGLDSWHLTSPPSSRLTDAEIPFYLYDDKLSNDVCYFFNKDILFTHTVGVLQYTHAGRHSQNFDEYSFWGDFSEGAKASRENALRSYQRKPQAENIQPFSDELRTRVTENLMLYPIQIARENPNVQFIYFLPPYSILRWDSIDRDGTLQQELDAWRLASELLLDVENIQLYAYCTDYETITDLSNFMDYVHYSPEINSQILQKIARGEGLLTKENYKAYWQEVENFYSSYDYDALFQEVTPSEK